ncbi:MAG: CC_3452 family protein [Chakrabartia sp.]
MRSLIALAALATSATLFAGTATDAFANGPAYRLVPATAFSAANSVVARDVLWKCAGDACVATKATSRPEVVCAAAVREIGKVTAFSANGKDFSAEQLEKCNAKAR